MRVSSRKIPALKPMALPWSVGLIASTRRFADLCLTAAALGWERAALYRTSNTDFFLCDRGGLERRWRLPDGKGAAPALVGADEARALLEAHGQFETAEIYLVTEFPSNVPLPVRLSGIMARKLEAATKTDRRSVNAWIVAAIKEKLVFAMRSLRNYFDAQEATGPLAG